MHLRQGGIPLSLMSQWIGHELLEIALIYAYASQKWNEKLSEKQNLLKKENKGHLR